MENEQESSVDELSAVAEPVSVGEQLRAARVEQKLDLEHISAETRIPVRHLEAIEHGAFEALPSRTYAIGFARNYAKAVELDETAITDAVRAELAEGHARQSAMVGGMEPGDPAKLPSAGLAWFGGFAAIALVVGVISFTSTYFGAGTGPGSLIAEESSEGADGALADAGGNAADDGDAALTNASLLSAGGQVVFTALEDGVWVRFYEDGGNRLFEKQMATGERFELPKDAAEPRINTGRPDALSITIDGQQVPKLANEPITIGDAPISAAALLARVDVADSPGGIQTATN